VFRIGIYEPLSLLCFGAILALCRLLEKGVQGTLTELLKAYQGITWLSTCGCITSSWKRLETALRSLWRALWSGHSDREVLTGKYVL
jgi:hypothetical protein